MEKFKYNSKKTVLNSIIKKEESCSDKTTYFDFFGLKLSSVKKEILIEDIKETIDKNQKKTIFGYSLGSIRLFNKYPIMISFGWETADIMLVDGRGLFLLGKFLKFPVEDDLSIPQLSKHLLELSEENKYSILFLGTKESINREATDKIKKCYKNIRVFNGINGYFTVEQEEQIVNQINSCKPDILFVGISSPKKEEFVKRWKEKLDVNIIILCGGVIDIFAGDKKQTPPWLKKIGGASLYRFIQEPVRLSKYFFPFVFFFFFNFLPVIILNVLILKNRDFSIPDFYIGKN
ncbi:MAG: WecB/TagA/CpsF family glycosyltransferase [Candidatus Cloacimonetes bacterium]|nr:WecB/TagA/CpsF family glycosyltransferase [Candidatus Cloacimonadota bacterium]